MSSPKIYRLLLAGLALVGRLESNVRADETSAGSSTNLPPAMRTVIRSEEVLDATNAKPIQRAFFSSGTNQFAFAVPGDFKLDATTPGKIILTSPDYSGFIAVQLVGPVDGGGAGLTVDSFRNLAMEEFPEGTIVGESELRVANHGGPAYDLRWKSYQGAQQLAFVGFVPSTAGVLKFSLLSNAAQFPVNQMNFRCLLRSFQSNESGKLEILPVSGAS